MDVRDDFGVEISLLAAKSWAGAEFMTLVGFQSISLSCLPSAACDCLSAVLGIVMHKFAVARAEHGTPPPNRSRGRGRGRGRRRARASSMVDDVVNPEPQPEPLSSLRFSVQNLYDCVVRFGLTMSFRSCFNYIMEHGVHTLVNYPSNPFFNRCHCLSDSINGRKITIGSWEILQSAEAVLQSLDMHPIIGSIRYTSIRDLSTDNPNFVADREDLSGPIRNGHALLIIGYGYDHSGLYFIVKNCWGIHWGFRGYLKFRPRVFYKFCSFDAVKWMEKHVVAV